MYTTGSKQGNEEWGDCSNMTMTIEKQSIEGSLGYFANGPIGFSSPRSKTSPKQYIEGKWGDRSNVFKTIEKQDN